MKFRRDAGEISVKAFRDIDRSPRRRDILKRTEELPVTSVGRPALLLRFVDRYCLNFVRQRKVLQEFRLGNSRFELQWQTGSEVRRRRNSSVSSQRRAPGSLVRRPRALQCLIRTRVMVDVDPA